MNVIHFGKSIYYFHTLLPSSEIRGKKKFPCCCKSIESTESVGGEDTQIVYRNKNNATLQIGYTFLISGQIYPRGDHFTIDFGLDNKNKDIALRITAYTARNVLCRNSYINNRWGSEETDSATPFSFIWNWNFEIQVLFHEDFIFIAVDSMHVAKYAHRLPLTDINSIEIRGDIKDVFIDHTFLTNYPLRRRSTPHVCYVFDRCHETPVQPATRGSGLRAVEEQFLPLPYYATFDRGFFAIGYSATIVGCISPNPNTIKVALQFSQSFFPQPAIALQVEFIFSKQSDHETVIILNTYAEDEWVGKFESVLTTALGPGANFNLHIARSKSAYKVHFNDAHICDYKHILNPHHVNTCLVDGDLKLIDVIMQSD